MTGLTCISFFWLMETIQLVLQGNGDVTEQYSIHKIKHRLKRYASLHCKAPKSNNNNGVTIIKLCSINQRRGSCLLPGYALSHMVWMCHGIAHGGTCCATVTLKRSGGGTRFRISKSELKCQPTLPQTNFVTLGKKAVSSDSYMKIKMLNEIIK